jgi:hypothetical protein
VWAFDLLHHNGARSARASSARAQSAAREANCFRKRQLAALPRKLRRWPRAAKGRRSHEARRDSL